MPASGMFRLDVASEKSRRAGPGERNPMKTEPWLWLAGLTALLAAQPALAQRSAREADQERGGEVPGWRVDEDFQKDVFTFVRVRYHRDPYGPRRAGYCFTDFPDSDLNLSYPLQQMTSIRVDPDGRGVPHARAAPAVRRGLQRQRPPERRDRRA